MWRSIKSVFTGGGDRSAHDGGDGGDGDYRYGQGGDMRRRRRRSFTADGESGSSGHGYDWFHPMASRPRPAPPASSATDPFSVASNPSVSSYNSSTRERQHQFIAMRYFGPSSQMEIPDLEWCQAQEEQGGGVAMDSNNNSDASQRMLGPCDVETIAPSAVSAAGVPLPLTREDFLLAKQKKREDETPDQRMVRKENERLFDSLVHLANTNQPVPLKTFARPKPNPKPTKKKKKKPSLLATSSSQDGSQDSIQDSSKGINQDAVDEHEELKQDQNEQDEEHEEDNEQEDPLDKQLNTELIEAYIAYARSIGHEPEIQLAVGQPHSDDEEDPLAAERRRLVRERKQLVAQTHKWTQWIGTRYSRQRGCAQFWSFLLLGVGVMAIMVWFLTSVRLNEVLHLDAFVGQQVVITDDYAYMHLQDEVGFRLTYNIHSSTGHDFQVLLLTETNYDKYTAGDRFSWIPEGSTSTRTTRASLSLTRIGNNDHDELFLVVQPCQLTTTGGDYCQQAGQHQQQLPTSVSSKQKIFALPKKRTATGTLREGFYLSSYYVNPMPDKCADSGLKGAPYLLIFVPYLGAALFGLRVFQMCFHCESFRANLERNYKTENRIPDDEVDYWQPIPWDRKVPKTRLCGPCCWIKMRRPFEPFYTWWRHENYFTWIFFPYRNERLARGERVIIVFCSLYITFYVTFVLTMLHGTLGADLPVALSVVLYSVALMVLPSLGKAIFKEVFKLIFRQRRKYFRLKQVGSDTSSFSFRMAFIAQVVVVVFISLAQGPMIYMWFYRSCRFLTEFLYFGLLAAFARLSVVALVQDYVWYVVIKAWGWRDLCPYCTERLVHCDCFNDELLVAAVAKVGAKWPLILVLDDVLSRHAGYEPQLALYSGEQLHERWLVLVARATAHLEQVDKLRAYRLKKKQERQRRRERRRRWSLVVRGGAEEEKKEDGGGGDEDDGEDEEEEEEEEEDEMDSTRERAILKLNSQIQLDAFEKHYDSTIVEVFHSMQQAVRGALRDTIIKPKTTAEMTAEEETEEERTRGERRRPETVEEGKGDGGKRMAPSLDVVLATPAQRLARREDERERRERVFHVLHGYNIHKRPENDNSSGRSTSRRGQGRARDDVDGIGSHSRSRRTSGGGGVAPGSLKRTATGWGVWPSRLGDAWEQTRELLLLPLVARDHQQQHHDQDHDEVDDDDDDLVHVVTEATPTAAMAAQERTNAHAVDPDHGADGHYAAASQQSPQPPPLSTTTTQTTYQVTERPPTLWDQTVGTVGSVVGRLLKYDGAQY